MIKKLHINNPSRLTCSNRAGSYRQLIYNLRTSTGKGLWRNQFINLTADFRTETYCIDILNMP